MVRIPSHIADMRRVVAKEERAVRRANIDESDQRTLDRILAARLAEKGVLPEGSGLTELKSFREQLLANYEEEVMHILTADSEPDEQLRSLSEHLTVPPVQEEAVEREHLEREIQRALLSLTPREERLLRLRYFPQNQDGSVYVKNQGFTDGMTLEEIGQEYGISRERVRQMEMKALRKLRHPARMRRLKAYETS
jgi:RNA polymerase primary sigma factor